MIASASPTISANEIRWDATRRRSGLASVVLLRPGVPLVSTAR
jgi:hypothetical protein